MLKIEAVIGRATGKLPGEEGKTFLCPQFINKKHFVVFSQDAAAAREGGEENPAIDAGAKIPQSGNFSSRFSSLIFESNLGASFKL